MEQLTRHSPPTTADQNGHTRPGPSFRIVSDLELLMQDPPSWLIKDMIEQGGSALLYGGAGCGKTTVAQAAAFAMAAGYPFLGNATSRGTAVHVAAEAGAGLGPRVEVWRQHYGIDPFDASGVSFLTEAPQLTQEADVAALLEALSTWPAPPALIVFDTLARCMVGADENSSLEMGRAVVAIDRIRRETGAAVLVLHHANSAEVRERGSTALRGAMDTVMSLSADGPIITLACEKQRNAEPFEKLTLVRRTVPLSDEKSACVVTLIDESGLREMTASDRQALTVLRSSFDEEGASGSAWKEAAGLTPSTFYRAQSHLQELGLVTKSGKLSGARYRPVAEAR